MANKIKLLLFTTLVFDWIRVHGLTIGRQGVLHFPLHHHEIMNEWMNEAKLFTEMHREILQASVWMNWLRNEIALSDKTTRTKTHWSNSTMKLGTCCSIAALDDIFDKTLHVFFWEFVFKSTYLIADWISEYE